MGRPLQPRDIVGVGMQILVDIAEGIVTDDPLGIAAETRNVVENPDYTPTDDSQFRVVIPFSGGLDSTFAWRLAEDAGWPTELFYIDTGAAYSNDERGVARMMGAKIRNIEQPVDYVKYAHIDLARNAIILHAVARAATKQGWWGHIWFGCHGNPGETTIRGGDKSFWFVNLMNRWIGEFGEELGNWTVQAPLIGLTKADMIRVADDRGWLGYLDRSLSCTEPRWDNHYGSMPCTVCDSCIQRFVAYAEAGLSAGYTVEQDAIDRMWEKRARQQIPDSANARRQQRVRNR